MASPRRRARTCRDLAKQYVDDPDVPADPDGAIFHALQKRNQRIDERVQGD